MLDVGKLCIRWLGTITAAEHLLELHFGLASRGVIGVVIGYGVNHQTFQYTLHFAFDFVEQQGKFARLDKVGNIVIGMKALASYFQAIADGYRNGYACVLVFKIHKSQCNRGVSVL